ncbi:MAG TPA: bifunctional riboflavin kinase/FAD synthetase [Nitrospirae bacterium]|nr:bifunctional riboflavin kinase/FAD synthetase [Nitrospirota bacterium]
MVIINNLTEPVKIKSAVVTIGNFDGIHLGHQKIFNALMEKTKEIKGTPTVITFDPHPLKVLAPERDLKMITTLEDKIKLLKRVGIKVLIVISFDRSFANIEASNFIEEYLVKRLKIKGIVVGHGYVFGKAKKGDTDLLRKKGKRYDFFVKVLRVKKIKKNVASSSRIRTLISKGKVKEANNLLRRVYHINGKVIKGTGRGESILKVPTANIQTTHELTPADGVYVVKVSLLDNGKKKVFDGVANIGKNPTFGNDFRSYEVHLFNYHKDLLGKDLRLHFIKKIREEICFNDINLLRDRILKDIQIAKEILKVEKAQLFLD